MQDSSLAHFLAMEKLSETNPPLVNLKGKEVRAFTLRRISVALGQQEKMDVHFHLLVRICCV